MADTSTAPSSVRFGSYEVDLLTRELRKDGTKVKLEGQPFEILALLVERPGELVTREELQRRLWPANRIVDFEHSINTAVKRLREALDDSTESPRFIETLPRRGYRFVHPVEQQPPATPASRSRLWTLGLPAAIALLLLVGLLALRDSPQPGAQSVAVAVLPLKNLSGDPGQDFFADGMTDALITELGKIRSLQVLSYHTVNRYRQSSKPLPHIAGELDVDVLLEGTVVRAGERVRMSAKLIQPSPERHIWAESYEFDARDVLAIQGKLARDVAARIRVKLTPQEEARLTASRRVDSATYEAYALGRAYLLKTPTPTNRVRAKEYFEQAIARGYAPAYASLAQLYVEHPGPISKNPQDARLKAQQLAEKALQLDETLAEAHTALARIAQQDWDWARAEREYKRAIELNPSYPIAHIWYATYLYAMQRFDEAAARARRAQQLDPVSPSINTYAAAAYFFAGRVEEAMTSWQKALELDPSYSEANTLLARAYVTQGRHEAAIAELKKALAFTPQEPQVLGAIAFAYARAGMRNEALRLVEELKRIEAERGNIRVFGIIWAYAGLGDKEAAFLRLEKAYEERRDRMVWLNVDPLLEPLRSDPRFQDLVRRMQLPRKS
jgi:TolB-like protein/DNA-binding winged helix-turn-helix (wHTH) protein/Flp pilus assembly protein TadD